MPKIDTQKSPAAITTRKTPPKATGLGIESRIEDIGYSDDDGISLLLYGESGTGKTTFWSSADGPILCAVCSGGSNPGELRSVDTEVNRARIKKITLREPQDLAEVVAYQQSTNRFKTVVLDHVTGFQDLVMAKILGMDKMPEQKTWGLATQQQYGQGTAQCKEFLRSLISLSCNVIVIAHEREHGKGNTDGELIAPVIGAALMPGLAGWLNGACDYICQTFKRQKTQAVTVKIAGAEKQTVQKVKGVDYCMRVGPDAIYTTKFRLPLGKELPDVIVNPTFPQLKKLIKG